MQQQRASLPFPPFLAAASVLAAIGMFISGSVAGGVAFLCVGAMFLLLGGNQEAWNSFPLWRRIAVVALLIVGAVGLLITFLSGYAH